MTLRKIVDLKDLIERLRKEANLSTGILSELERNLKEEFDCNIKQAEVKIVNLDVEIQELIKEKEELLSEFLDKYSNLLDE